VLVLLPPSEGKFSPRRGRPLDLAALSFPVLHEPRAAVLDALVSLCRDRPAEEAASALGIGTTQLDLVRRDAELASAPTARADRVYTGVLYEALDLASLPAAPRRRAAGRLVVVSSLLGLVRTTDHVPAYRLSGQNSLPGLGPVSRHWSRHLGPSVVEAAGDGLVVDLRSSSYVPFWRPTKEHAGRVATVRVLHESGGRRSVVSHFNKATKGRLVRDLLTDGSSPRTPARFAELLRDLGWSVEADGADPTRLDVVVRQL
jgi:cytoplasmic iron level regulating protein YaaA (DUF328/UPF0246 family)